MILMVFYHNLYIYKTALHVSLGDGTFLVINEIVHLLLSYKGIDVNIQNNEGRSPIMIAQKKNKNEIVELLMNNPKTNLNIIDKKGKSLLSLSYKNHDLFSKLVHNENIDLNVNGKKGITPLHNAVILNDIELVSFILNSKRNLVPIDSKTNDGSSFMHLAIKNKSMKMLTFFEKLGLNFNLQNKNGQTPLMILIMQPSPITDIWNHILRKEDLDINIKDKDGVY